MNTFLESERNFLDEGVPYTIKIQCAPKRVYKMKLEFTNRYWQDWRECLNKYFERVKQARKFMVGYFECLRRIKGYFSEDPKVEDVAQNNLLFFLKIASCISEPNDYCKFVKGLLDEEIIVTPELPVTGCICSKEQLSGENLSKREMQIEIDLDKEFNEKKAPIVAKLRVSTRSRN